MVHLDGDHGIYINKMNVLKNEIFRYVITSVEISFDYMIFVMRQLYR